MPPPAVPETLAALRQATSSAHTAIDQQLRLGDDLSLARYVAILAGFESFLTAWEPAVAAALPASARAWAADRSRLPLVRADLGQLAPGRMTLRPPVLPPLGDTAAAMGSLYVLEGSALGGQVIARRVADRFGFDALRGAAYFHGFGARTGALWREFRERLEVDVPPHARASACDAAVATFDSLATHFRHVLRDEPALA